MAKLACAALLAAGLLPRPAAAQIVEGTVVNAVTGAGLPGVKVGLYQGGDLYYSATTDAEGRFRFDHVQNGSYRDDYTAPDYQFSDPLRQVPVMAGTPVQLEARMMPMGRLSGRVLDAKGQPVPHAEVTAAGPGVVMTVAADADGRFEQHRLLFPGAYTLSAVPPAGLKPPDPEPGSHAPTGWVRTYYPHGADPQSASRVLLAPGGELANLDIKLIAVKTHALRGVLLNPDGTPAARLDVRAEGLQPALHAETNVDGAFEFPAMVDGQWALSAEVERLRVKLRVTQVLEMAGRDLEDLKLQLAGPFTVRARVVMEAPQGIPAPRPWAVLLTPAERSLGLPRRAGVASARLENDGTTTLQNVYPDKYEVLALAPPGYYLDAVRVGDAELTSALFDLLAPLPITAFFKTNGGAVRGTAGNCGQGGVLLVAQDPAERWLARDLRARCDSQGRYELTAVRPGDYYALATAPEPYSTFWVATWDDSLIDQAARVTVKAGEVSTLDLKAIARPQ